MRKTVLILTIVGGIFGVINNIVFYVGGVLTSFFLTHLFIPFLYLTSLDDAFKRMVVINAVTASILCIVAVIAGILYYIGDESDEQKHRSKYAATIVLIAISAGLIISFSFITMILIVLATVFAVISVRDDYRNKLVPADDKFRTTIKITVLLSVIVLIGLIVLSVAVLTGNFIYYYVN